MRGVEFEGSGPSGHARICATVVHFEISDLPDKAAPRVIVETPIDAEYCPSRQAIANALARQHFRLRYVSNANVSRSELRQPLFWAWHFATSDTTGEAKRSARRGNSTRQK